MAVKRAGKKQIYKKYIVVLVCLLIAGNSAHGVVLCFGADGHIEIESAFHKRCGDHSQLTDQKQLCCQSDHEQHKHCEPCVDVPLSIGLAKISRVSNQLSTTSPTPVVNIILLSDKFEFSAYRSASNTFDAVSYFSPLRTVILLI